MQASSQKSSPCKSGRRSPHSSSSEDFDDDGELGCIDGNELSDLEDLSAEAATTAAASQRKPHFLDYDYMERENPGESLKIDKSLERDGEISDHILTAAYSNEKKYKNIAEKKKHFLDENPIEPPEYREHRSLDRLDDRKNKQKDNYTLNRFIEREVPNSEAYRGTWPTVSEASIPCRYASMPPAAVDLGPKVECVYSLLSMLGSHNSEEMSTKFLELSRNRETCAALRRSGCISILVQLQHNDPDENVRKKASAALHNVVHCHIDDKFARREMRVLKQIELLIQFCDVLRSLNAGNTMADDSDSHPVHAIGTLMKTSFDEDHRHAMCQLGALQTISTLVQMDHQAHGATSEDPNCVTLRRYAGMTLTNLTFGDGNNKALLCSNRGFMRALVSQIDSASDELVQVTASVLRNLSWRADPNMKAVLSEIGAVTILTKAAMRYTMENTLKAILSALWNLSNSPQNKAEFCECEGAIDFLIDMLNYEAPSKTMHVIENAGGILRNVSSYIASKEEYRAILRRRNCLGILLQQLKSSSLTVVSNASGTLGNLSANSIEDQKFLRDNGAIPMLRSLICSKHKMISTGCTLALRNLLNLQKSGLNGQHIDSVSRSLDLKELPTLSARKQKALEQELDQNLANSCSSDEVTTPPKDFGTTRSLMNRCFKTPPPPPSSATVPDAPPKQSSFDSEVDERPIDYSKKYSEPPIPGPSTKVTTGFQETDLDQPTDYSKRYAENDVSDSEDDKSSPFDQSQILVDKPVEDQVKSYCVEGTPKVISNAPSITDLRKTALAPSKSDVVSKKSTTNSGIHSPERPVNYCVEGTPGGLSRCDSLSDLESDGIKSKQNRTVPGTPPKEEEEEEKKPAVVSVNFADETPLMFSRTSSLGSLGSQESVCNADDRSSVVSEFSRLASGIISPSEIPESPLQSIPHSPRQRTRFRQDSNLLTVRDEVNTFAVENTPAQFSCATSLSNLSLDDEPKITKDCLVKEMQLMSHPSEEQEDEYVLHYAEDGSPSKNQSGVELNSDESENEEDGGLLESAINIGMRRVPMSEDTMQQYCTEDTPAVLSKVGSSSNLSILSVETRNDAVSDDGDDMLLEAAIQSGIDGVRSSQLPHEDPIAKLRRGALPPYFPTCDETNRFNVEDSPRAFSTVSALSDITVGSGVAGLAKFKSSPPKPPQPYDSLSSLSVESEDDAELLNAAISAGSAVPQRVQTAEANDSLSSVDSCDSESQSHLLDQVVHAGMNRVVKKTSRPRTTKKVSDQQLLEQVIQSGINGSASGSGPKNVQTTPEVGLETTITTNGAASTTPGVVRKQKEATMMTVMNGQQQHGTTNIHGDDNTAVAAVTPLRRREAAITQSGNHWLNISATSETLLTQSNEYPALRLSGYEFVDEASEAMEVSNEFMIERQESSQEQQQEVEKVVTMEDKRKNPDLMLRSVDRLTQELVATAEYLRAQQSSKPREYDDGSNNNTWNDSNESSFPSLSGCPMNGSTNDDENTFNDLKSSAFSARYPPPDEEEPTPTNEMRRFDDEVDAVRDAEIKFQLGGEVNAAIPSFQSSGPLSIDSCSTTMTNSTIIFMEANKVVTDLQSLSPADSLASLDLDHIRPPSVMDCVSLSTVTFDMPGSPQLRTRKSIPTGIMAKRALGMTRTVIAGSVESINSLAGNLDNIKPPSIMDELLDSMISVASITSEVADTSQYETAVSEMDDTTLQSCCADLLSDATPVPSDFSSNESTPKKGGIRRTLTPKQKRQMAKDRYRTYTIAADMVLKERADALNEPEVEEEEDEVLQVEVQKVTLRQKRKDDRARFETQVLDTSQLNLSSASEGSESPSVRRRITDPDRYRTRTLSSTSSAVEEGAADCTSLEDLSIKAVTAQLKFLRDPRQINLTRTSTNIMAIRDEKSSSDITSLEYEQNSETESCDQNREFSDSNDERVIPRPRIVKPVEVNLDSAGDEGCSSPEPRGVRGRKKPAYVSPYRMQSTPPKSVSPQPRSIIAKTHVIINKANLTSKIRGLARPGFIRNGGMTKSKTYTEMSSHCEPALERQGTFVKEEGTDLNVPVVTSAPPTPAKTSKLPTKIPPPPKSAPAARTRTSLVSKLKIPLQKSTTQNIAPVPSKPLKRFGAGVYKSPSVPTVPQRSNSNMSIGKSIVKSSNNVSAMPPPPPKKDITSRIAGLWKKVDESKKQQQQGKKDTRVWIGSSKKVDQPAPPPPPLIRSSTFDASPENSTGKDASNLPVITKARTLRSPSSGNLDGRFLSAGLRRH